MEPPEPLSQLMAAEPDRPTTTGPMQSYTVAQCVSSVGSWMQTTAMGWLAWDLTHSVRWVGAMALMDLVALLWVAPLAGTVTDRRSPYRLFMVTQLLMLVDAALMCGLAYTGHLSIGLLMVFALIEATLNGFNNPVRMTSVNLLSTPGAMSKAVAMNSLGMSLALSGRGREPRLIISRYPTHENSGISGDKALQFRLRFLLTRQICSCETAIWWTCTSPPE